ncbi:PepSY domain-containing protein [Micromonospora krabiensis]|uniref:Peptidase propeptide and YPEB domain-containing protein n=1 Tax=Micromonospora krabiensis TaxID=307121 RepID=A0A1C3N4Z6_9ACTN|nr:PepSY domain-containing protein [Micromonospora krabiensis]SBV27662.1 Peptidase propeptide and YPEB domain-containing protein [Micromonospora krabiensis]
MKRSAILLASAGGAAVLAVAGVAVGVTAADGDRNRGTTLAAATVDPTDPATPTEGATPDDSATAGTPSGSATAGTPSGTPTTGGTSTPPAGGDRVDQQRAGEIALARVGGGRIVEVEAEQEHGRPVWSVEVVDGNTEHDIDVDRDNGTVLRAEQEAADDDDDDDDRDDDDDDKDDDD